MVRQAVRQLSGHPRFTLLAVLGLALGIGLNTAAFSALYALLWRPLPYQDADRLFLLYENQLAQGETQLLLAPPMFREWQRRSRCFESLGGVAPAPLILTVPRERGSRLSKPPRLLELAEYQSILEDVEELESIRAYDLAKAAGEEPIPFEQAIQEIERLRRGTTASRSFREGDRSEPKKRERALQLIQELRLAAAGVLFPQVLQEYFAAATRKLPAAIARREAPPPQFEGKVIRSAP